MLRSIPSLEAVAWLVSRTRTSLLLIAAWLLILPVAGFLSSKLYGLTSNDPSSYLPGRRGGRLQHLPDDAGARGGGQAPPPARGSGRAARDGGVITSAGIVLAATFATLSVMPLVFMIEMGTLVALGVLIDTLIVRSIVVPALALDLGPATWWPSLPNPTYESDTNSATAA